MSNIAEAPQDSVLRRHWQSSREIQTSHKQSNSNNANASSSGFFSWLKSLFS